MKRSSNLSGVLALAALGAFYVWRNRFEIQRFLESRGIDTRLDRSSLRNMVRSGAAKISGRLERPKHIHVTEDFPSARKAA